MPYKSAEKKKEYYHRHGKQYLTDWRKKSGLWNEYQRSYKLKRIREQAIRIKKQALEYNIDEPDSKTTKAWCVLILMLETGITQEWAIARRLEYDFLNDVKPIFSNLRENKIWDGKYLDMDLTGDSHQVLAEILLCAMCGAG
jgi:hypothetical protein